MEGVIGTVTIGSQAHPLGHSRGRRGKGELQESVDYKLSLLFGGTVGQACGVSSSPCICEDNEIAVEFLQKASASLYESNCPLWTTGSKRKVPWWSTPLRNQKTAEYGQKNWNAFRLRILHGGSMELTNVLSGILGERVG
jgi:hypothetical protein